RKKDMNGWTALHTAAAYQPTFIFRKLIESLNGENICKYLNMSIINGRTLFHILVRKQDLESFKKLREKISTESFNDYLCLECNGETSVHLLAVYQDAKCFEELVSLPILVQIFKSSPNILSVLQKHQPARLAQLLQDKDCFNALLETKLEK